MKKIIITMMAFLLLINLASAVQFNQVKSFQGNLTTRDHIIFFWDFGDLTGDHIKSGNPLQTYLQYSIYPNTWNENNPDYEIDNCNLTIYFSDNMANQSVLEYSKIYNSNVDDDFNLKYFFQLDKGDGYTATVDCFFANQRPTLLEMPVTITPIIPTWECKACQLYEWSKLEIDVAKAKTLGDNTVEVISFMKELVLLNFEILIAIFWLIVLGIGFTAISLIFIGIYWLYIYMRSLAK